MKEKLVRDAIPSIIAREKGKVEYRKLSNQSEEYYKFLKNKLQEEVDEYFESDAIIEIADIYEVIINILNYRNIPLNEFEKIIEYKRYKKGSFNCGFCMKFEDQ